MLEDRLRRLGAAGVPIRRAAPLDPTPRVSRRERRRRAQGGAARDLAQATAVGVPPRAPAAPRRRLEDQSQAHAAAVARGGPACPAAQAQAPAARELDRPAERLRPSGQITCGRWTSSSIRPPTGGTSSSCCTSWMSSRGRHWRSSVAGASTPTRPSRYSTGSSSSVAPPAFIRCDNGPELTTNALRDWCRFSLAGSAYIEPGSPWQNPYVESFGSRIRDELLAVELFSCLAEAQVLVEDWRRDYRGRDGHCWPPPAQIPACASNALGS